MKQSSILLVIATGVFLVSAVSAAEPQFYVVYDGTEGGYAIVRTPQILATEAGTLLVFAQGRSGRHDQSDNDILVKRSTDGGKTWSKLHVIADQGKDALNSICVVQVRPTGRILVVGCSFPYGYEQMEFQYLSANMQEYQRRNGRDKNPAVKAGYEGRDVARNYIVHSDDDGRTWSPMRDVTPMLKAPAPSVGCVPGPGLAIQLREGPHAGRIVVPCFSRLLDRKRTRPVYVTLPYAAISDDGGQTWQRGELAPGGDTRTSKEANETQMVELPGGALLLNARSVGRLVSTSRDGGKTWTPLRDEPALAGPPTAAGFLRYSGIGDGAKSRLVFSHPAETRRTDGTIYLSYDDGRTWPVKKLLHKGRFDYSCLSRLRDGELGCVFGSVGGAGGSPEIKGHTVLLARFTLAWLTDGKDEGP